MGALVKNGDLLPDADLLVAKRQTYEAMLRVGISEKVAHETSEANFRSNACPTCALVYYSTRQVSHFICV